MNKCLIFGGNGFIGSHLAEGLVNKGYSVTVFDNFKNGITNLETIKNKIEIINGNFLNEREVDKALNNIDYVFHYISTTVPATAKNNPIYDIETNISGSVKLFQQTVKNKVKKLIFSSSGGTVYGEPVKIPVAENDPANPIDPYGISKLTIEKYLYYFNYAYGLDYKILRYSNPYGERQNPLGIQGVIPIFLNKIKQNNQPTIYDDGSMIRDYLYIKDAIDATIAVLESNTQEKLFNVGSGEGTSLNELIDIMSHVVREEIRPDYLQKSGNYVHKIILDVSKIQKQVGWKRKVDLDEGIRRTWEWINKQF